MTASGAGTAVFEQERSRLLGIAYRVTGSRAEAEDVVQDAWIRWQQSDQDGVQHPAAWLTTVTSRLAIDRLRSARHRRETYVGPWLPEAVDAAPGPADRSELAESLTLGFLTVLERLGPVERVVFLLADVFAVPFDEIARTVDRSPEACRQIASRARRRVHEGRPRFEPTGDDAWAITGAFLVAAQEGDLDTLLALLAPDALAISDGGADHHAARRPVVAERIPRFMANLAARLPEDAVLELRTLNAQPSLVVLENGVATSTVTFAVADGLIHRIWTIRNPEKLAGLTLPGIP